MGAAVHPSEAAHETNPNGSGPASAIVSRTSSHLLPATAIQARGDGDSAYVEENEQGRNSLSHQPAGTLARKCRLCNFEARGTCGACLGDYCRLHFAMEAHGCRFSPTQAHQTSMAQEEAALEREQALLQRILNLSPLRPRADLGGEEERRGDRGEGEGAEQQLRKSSTDRQAESTAPDRTPPPPPTEPRLNTYGLVDGVGENARITSEEPIDQMEGQLCLNRPTTGLRSPNTMGHPLTCLNCELLILPAGRGIWCSLCRFGPMCGNCWKEHVRMPGTPNVLDQAEHLSTPASAGRRAHRQRVPGLRLLRQQRL